jgi:hypothetical protein
MIETTTPQSGSGDKQIQLAIAFPSTSCSYTMVTIQSVCVKASISEMSITAPSNSKILNLKDICFALEIEWRKRITGLQQLRSGLANG